MHPQQLRDDEKHVNKAHSYSNEQTRSPPPPAPTATTAARRQGACEGGAAAARTHGTWRVWLALMQSQARLGGLPWPAAAPCHLPCLQPVQRLHHPLECHRPGPELVSARHTDAFKSFDKRRKQARPMLQVHSVGLFDPQFEYKQLAMNLLSLRERQGDSSGTAVL